MFGLLGERYESPQQRGRVFERLMGYAFERHPDVYGPARFKAVWRWMDWPDREAHGYGPDLGIDLVAEQTEAWGGGLCAIQTKFFAESHKIAKGDVDTFLSTSSAAIFSARILVVTSELNAHAQTVVSKTSPRCEVVSRADIESWPVDWSEFLNAPERLAFRPVCYDPHPYQSEAVQKVVSGFADNDRGKLILPCGTGKSVVALWIAEQVAGVGGRVLYLVPSIALMGQTMREWSRQADPRIPHRYIGICSDTRAGRSDEDADMAELAMPVTTDPERIAGTLKEVHPEAMTAVFCTYQSLELVAAAQDKGAPAFDLAICDEAHRTTGIQESTDLSVFTLIHDSASVLADKRLYMTATPRLYTNQVKSKAREHARDLDVYSMDDEDVYGPELFRMGFGEAVDGGYLTDYRVLVIAVAEHEMLHNIEMIGVGEGLPAVTIDEAVRFVGCWDALADPTTRSAQDRVTGAVHERFAARRAIAFTNTIKNSMKVERYWEPITEVIAPARRGGVELLDCAIRHVDGSRNALNRANTIAWLQQGSPDECRIVTNAKCLTEGVDVPALDAVLFLEPKRSQVDVVQAVGRVMRRSEGKECGYVVLPVVVPDGANLADDSVLSGSDFKQVWNVLKALRSHDDRLDVAVNTADLTGRLPVTILTSGVCDKCGSSSCDGGDDCPERLRVTEVIQGTLPFENAIASKLVGACGDRQYWDRWGKEVAKITKTITARVRSVIDHNDELAKRFAEFTEQMETTIGGSLPSGDLAVMVAQHVVTMPVFDALFAGSDFADRNPISKALNELLGEFKDHDVRLADDTTNLDRFYANVRVRLEGARDSDARIKIMLEVYESFFAEAMPREVQSLGIVYTPLELVDFVLRSVDAVLRQEFGRGLSAQDVHILDPFTGTGTFIHRLLTQNNSAGEPLIADEDVERKFCNTHHPTMPGGSVQEIHANELVLLAYYLAALKIEEGYRDRTGHYQPFSGIVLTDTFQHDPSTLPGTGAISYNTARAQQQHDLPIRVIVGNPPWSAGQKSSGDDNPRREYPHVEQRVRDTYGMRHREVTRKAAGGNSAGNLYVQAIRWASDRINHPGGADQPGVIAFVHPNSVCNATSLAGMRATLRDEFTDIYVVNLLGDAMKSDEEREKEGQVVFGIDIRVKSDGTTSEIRKGTGSRNGVQITVLVRNPGKDPSEPATLHYAQVPEYSTLKQKFDWLDTLGDVTNPALETVPINDAHDWVNISDGTFNDLLPVCDSGRTQYVAVEAHASGVKTNCDTYVYSFSKDGLAAKVNDLIDAYNDAYTLHHDLGMTLEECTENTDLAIIKWTDTLKGSLKKGEVIEFEESRIREVLYRPFTKLWLYEDDRILSSVKTVSAMFPRDATHTHTHTHISSAAQPTGHGSPFSQPTAYSTSTTSTGAAAPSHDSDPGLGDVEHDVSSHGIEDSSRPGDDRGITPDAGDPQNQTLKRGGGGGGVWGGTQQRPFGGAAAKRLFGRRAN
ncbi:MAG: DEAD/DEAH box helicase family protein, partial [Acidimicrobiaceae bacterium]|nr:DEAD/DEAH box helicase family protein [Acidimicrobiaceae bacterium]